MWHGAASSGAVSVPFRSRPYKTAERNGEEVSEMGPGPGPGPGPGRTKLSL